MILRRFCIENFRGISSLELELDRTTVLIGANNTGKTSVLEALHTCMSRNVSRRAHPFTEYDFHLENERSEPADAPPLVLTLTFEESEPDEWPDEIPQALPNATQTLDDGRQCLMFRVRAEYDRQTNDFAVDWSFLDRAGNVLPTARQSNLVVALQRLAPVFLLNAVRDASQHFHARSSFWNPFTKNSQISDEKRSEIEEQIEQLNQSVLDSHKPFEVVKERVAQTGKLLPIGIEDPVTIEAVPARISDILAQTQVKLASRTGARLPLAKHGAGTQSLSVLFLFEAFLQARLSDAYNDYSEPVLALEEPESHLHPSAIRGLWATLDRLVGQKIIATHSGDLLTAVPLKAIRRLARKNGRIEVFRVGETTLDHREEQKVNYHIRAKRGALLFASCWLLVEGETEFTILPELARLLGYDVELEGVACVEFAQCGVKPLIKVAKDLGIEWHLLADGDQAGAKYVKSAAPLLGNDQEMDRITEIAAPDIEHCLWRGGYSAVYKSAVADKHKSLIKAAPDTTEHQTQTIAAAIKSTSKPHLAYAVIAEADEVEGAISPSVPESLKTVIETAVKLARRSA